MSDHTKQTSENLSELQSPQELFRKFGHLSMMGRRRFIKNLNLAQSLRIDIGQHSIVECGVWRGGASFAMMNLFPECPEFHLFDSFEGLPEPSERDGQKAIQLSEENLFVEGRNFASFEKLMEEVNKFGFRDRTTVHKGWFDETVFAKKIDRPIGILRLDGDWYESTETVLDRLFDSVATGGLIIVDDYFDWPGCSQAVHDFLSEQKLPDAVRTFDNLVAHIVKKPSDYLGSVAGENELARRRRNNSSLDL